MILENDTPYNKPNKNERRSRITNPTPYSGLGMLPPQAIDAEEVILGALLLVKVSPIIFSTIKAEFFYKDNHQRIYEAITSLRADKIGIDLITVKNRLAKMEQLEMIGGAYYLTELTQRVAGSQNIEFYITIVHEMFLKREIIRIGSQAVQDTYQENADPFERMVIIIREINDLKKNIFKRTEKRADQLVHEAIEEMHRPKPKGLLGISTGLRGIDHITQGDQEGQLIIDAARPGMGKTAKMCSEILNCSFEFTKDKGVQVLKDKVPVACFSLEMRDVQLTFRMLSNLSDIDNLKIKKNQLTDQEISRFHEYAEMFSEAPIYIDDTPGLSIDEFEAKAAMLVALHGVRKIYIDYLQLMTGERRKKYNNREEVVSDISRRLKTCASELGITIIALCQLSRAVESRKFCMPILSDLRESGSIEQDADVVRFLWRPEYYPEVMAELIKANTGIKVELFNINISTYEGLLFCIVAKCREERTGKVPLRFKGAIMRVSDHSQVLDILDAAKQDLFYIDHNDEKGDVF